MNAKTYCTLSAVVFTVVSVGHLVRAIRDLPLSVGGWQVPVSLSWAGAAFTAALAVWGFRLATRAS